MAPEHALNHEVDARSDLYALGVILWELLSGKLPFKGRSDPETLYQHAFQPLPKLSEVALSPVSTGFLAVIERALAKRPEDRFADAEVMRAAIEDLKIAAPTPPLEVRGGVPERQPEPSPPSAPAARGPGPWRFAVVVLLLTLAGAGWWWRPTSTGSPATSRAEPPTPPPQTAPTPNPLPPPEAPIVAEPSKEPIPRVRSSRRAATPGKDLLEQRIEDLVDDADH